MVEMRLKEPYVSYGISVIITLMAIVFFQIVGYPKVVTPNQILDIYTSPLYMIPIFIPIGILMGELIWMILNRELFRKEKLIIMLLGLMSIIILSFFRYIFGLPYSGHTLILGFYLPYQLTKLEKKAPLRIIIGFIVLFITSIYKIFFWLDLITYLYGLSIGFLIWVFSYPIIIKKNQKNENK